MDVGGSFNRRVKPSLHRLARTTDGRARAKAGSPNSDLCAGIVMSIERRSKLWSDPSIVPADPATERDQLIAANQAFAAALLQHGAETSAGVLATVSPKRGKNRNLALSTS